jgi:copper(I)-binding protein
MFRIYDPLRRMSGFFIVLTALVLCPSIVFAANWIRTTSASMRPVPTSTSISATYLAIENGANESNLLQPVEADFAQSKENHEMSMHGAVRKMPHVVDGIEIPEKDSVEFKPYGHHIMFIQIQEPILASEKRIIRFVFENAGEVSVEFSTGHSTVAG